MELKELMMDLYRHMTTDEFNSIKQFGEGRDLSYMDAVYLDIIFLNGSSTPTAISERLGIAKSAVTVRVNSLEKKGYVSRSKDENDKRSTVLTLTEKGMDWYRPMIETFDRYERILKGTFSEDEQDVIRRALECLIRDTRRRSDSFSRSSL